MSDGQDDSRATPSGEDGSPGERAVPAGVLELDHVFEALAHPRRRYLCYTLLERTEWTLPELATRIAAWEHRIPEAAVTEQRAEEVSVSLHHAHVPKLVDLGVASYSETTERISASDHAPQVLTAPESLGASLDSMQEAHARSGDDE